MRKRRHFGLMFGMFPAVVRVTRDAVLVWTPLGRDEYLRTETDPVVHYGWANFLRRGVWIKRTGGRRRDFLMFQTPRWRRLMQELDELGWLTAPDPALEPLPPDITADRVPTRFGL